MLGEENKEENKKEKQGGRKEEQRWYSLTRQQLLKIRNYQWLDLSFLSGTVTSKTNGAEYNTYLSQEEKKKF